MRETNESPIALVVAAVAIAVLGLFALSLGAVVLVSRYTEPQVGVLVTAPTQSLASSGPDETISAEPTAATDRLSESLATEVPAATMTRLPAATVDVITATPIPPSPATNTAEPPTSTPTTIFPQISPSPASASPSNATSTTTRPEVLIEDSFNSSESGWPITVEERRSAEYANGQYVLTLAGETTIGISYPLNAERYQLSADVTVQEGAAGLIFLFSDPATYYVFVTTADGEYALQRHDGDVITNIIDWTSSPALIRGSGTTNRLRTERRGNNLELFANGQFLTEFTVPEKGLASRYGFVLISPQARGRAIFDNLLIEAIE